MPKIDFCFSGWVRGADIDTVFDTKQGANVDISSVTAAELIAKITAGEWLISLKDYLLAGDSEEIEIFDFEETGKVDGFEDPF